MYYPYFRGKQYELIAVRECAELLSAAGFVPIIEPVQESLTTLKRSLSALQDANASAIIVINPFFGNHADDAKEIESLFANELKDWAGASVGIALRQDTSVEEATRLFHKYAQRHITFIHEGFSAPSALVESLGAGVLNARHVFFEEFCRKLYQKHFKDAQRILLRDGFKKRTSNWEHPDLEPFSELHVTFEDEGMDGFGDFLVVGDEYSESGGPAYTVAIHLTFIDPNNEEQMFVHHFKSLRHDTPTDPAGKFAEALTKLVAAVTRQGSHIARTGAVKEFLDLHTRKHYPGLGYVKKLSMIHHIETLAGYFAQQRQ